MAGMVGGCGFGLAMCISLRVWLFVLYLLCLVGFITDMFLVWRAVCWNYCWL